MRPDRPPLHDLLYASEGHSLLYSLQDSLQGMLRISMYTRVYASMHATAANLVTSLCDSRERSMEEQ